MSVVTPAHCALIAPLLRERDGEATLVQLRDGRTFEVLNIAWGIDDGDDFEHVSTNVSPSVEGKSFDFFHTDEVLRVVDPETGRDLWIADGEASVR